MINNKDKQKIDCFITEPERNADMKARAELTKEAHNESKDVLQALSVLRKLYHYR